MRIKKNERQDGLKNMTNFVQFMNALNLNQDNNDTVLAKLKELHEKHNLYKYEKKEVRKFYKLVNETLSNRNIPTTDYMIKHFPLSNGQSTKSFSVIYSTGIYNFTHQINYDEKEGKIHTILLNGHSIGKFAHDDTVLIIPIVQRGGLSQAKILWIQPESGGAKDCTHYIDSYTIAVDERYVNEIELICDENKELKELNNYITWDAYKKGTLNNYITWDAYKKGTLNNIFNLRAAHWWYTPTQFTSGFFAKFASEIHLMKEEQQVLQNYTRLNGIRLPKEVENIILKYTNLLIATQQMNFKLDENTSYNIFYLNKSPFENFEYRNTKIAPNKVKEKMGLYHNDSYFVGDIYPKEQYFFNLPEKAYVLCLILPVSPITAGTEEEEEEEEEININWLSYYVHSDPDSDTNQIVFLASESYNRSIDKDSTKNGVAKRIKDFKQVQINFKELTNPNKCLELSNLEPAKFRYSRFIKKMLQYKDCLRYTKCTPENEFYQFLTIHAFTYSYYRAGSPKIEYLPNKENDQYCWLYVDGQETKFPFLLEENTFHIFIIMEIGLGSITMDYVKLKEEKSGRYVYSSGFENDRRRNYGWSVARANRSGAPYAE